MRLSVLILAVLFSSGALAQAKPGTPPQVQSAPPVDFKPLPERKDIVSWKLLAQVEPVKMKDKLVPQFSDAVLALYQKTVKVQGFMLPLETGAKISRFLLSAVPQSCPFHLHVGGAESLIEIRTTKPMAFTWDGVTFRGTTGAQIPIDGGSDRVV